MAGLVETVGVTEGRAYNVWKVLGVTVGVQWCFLVLGAVAWLVMRRNERKLSLVEEVLVQVVRRFSGSEGARGWNGLYRAGEGYRAILGWRVARVLQWGGVALNAGILIGFYAILLFLEVNFFWATTIDEFGLPQLERTTQVLSSPWRWYAPEWVPTREQLLSSQLQVGQLNEESEARPWYMFIISTLLLWVLVPRIVMTGMCHDMERLQRRRLTFMEKRYRELWRMLSPGAQREGVTSGPRDGVTLIDVGGTDVKTEELRPFLLQQMRVNPEARYRAAVLTSDEREEALRAIRQGAQGVILLVDSWDLSPKLLEALHERVREAAPDQEIYYLVLGVPQGGVTQAPEEAEVEQWKNYVDELQDAEAELIIYQPKES